MNQYSRDIHAFYDEPEDIRRVIGRDFKYRLKHKKPFLKRTELWADFTEEAILFRRVFAWAQRYYPREMMILDQEALDACLLRCDLCRVEREPDAAVLYERAPLNGDTFAVCYVWKRNMLLCYEHMLLYHMYYNERLPGDYKTWENERRGRKEMADMGAYERQMRKLYEGNPWRRRIADAPKKPPPDVE